MSEEIKSEKAQLSYEQALDGLEKTLRRLDDGDLPLEEAIGCFQEGLDYIKVCQEKLTAAEGKLKVLCGGEFVERELSAQRSETV